SVTVLLFFFHTYVNHRDLHSFPTRRSSDLVKGTTSNARPNDLFIACLRWRTFTQCKASGLDCHCEIEPELIPSIADWCGSLRFRSEEHTSELQSRFDLVCRLLLEKKKI